MNIIPKLNLNKHPKDNENLSFVKAVNIKLSNDESCITNEESIKENTIINDFLNEFYLNKNENGYTIIGIIPCSDELVIICTGKVNTDKAQIFRYKENNNTIKCVYGNDDTKYLKYHNGKIKGTFTYNVENGLVLAIAEYDTEEKVPLRIINLGDYDNENIYNDIELNDESLSLSPEIKLPNIDNLNYIAGSAYKGWYYIFIRFKLNSVDYTQWYSIGFPIYIDTIEQFNIIRYAYNRETHLDTNTDDNPLTTDAWEIVAPSRPRDGFGTGCSDYFSNTSDIAKETFKIDIQFDASISYKEYQIGVICSSKSYTKAFRTEDINIESNKKIKASYIVNEYILNNKNLIEYSAQELIIDNYNYFNVKNIINYKNKLYISNYLENNANNKNITEDIINDINVTLVKTTLKDYSNTYDVPIMTSDIVNYPNQYDSYKKTCIPLYKYLGVDENIEIVVAGTERQIGPAGQFFIICGDTIPNYAYIEFKKDYVLGVPEIIYIGKDEAIDISIFLLTNQGNDAPIAKFNTRKNALNGGTRYNNNNISFNDRKINSTLIPGEVYNFFIHFVDKYGHCTNGYRINNKIKWFTEDDTNNEIVPIPFLRQYNEGREFKYETCYAAIMLDNNVSVYDNNTNKYIINTDNIKFYKSSNNNIQQLQTKISDSDIETYKEAFIDYYSSYANNKYTNTKWYQIINSTDIINFNIYINNNGDRLFKVPVPESYKYFTENIISLNEFKYGFTHTLFRVKFDNITIPEGYIGYFISYEKYEPTQRVTGILTRNDFRSQDYVNNVKQFTANCSKSNKMLFYSSVFDISDTLKLDYNVLRIEGINIFDTEDIPTWDYFQRNNGFVFMHNMNKTQIDSHCSGLIKSYAMPNYKLSVGDSAIDNRIGVGTCLSIDDSYNLFASYDPTESINNRIKLYRATILNYTRNIYMSTNKILIRLTDIKYKNDNDDENTKYSTNIIQYGYNGHFTYDGILVYENAGVSFNEQDNKVRRVNNNTEYYPSEVKKETPHVYENDIPFAAYCQFPICSDIFFESKSFKNEPKGIIYLTYYNESDQSNNSYSTGCMVTPQNSIDLFQNKQNSSDELNPKTYTNYREDLVSIDNFDKTIRRSNVIQDESRINGWRTFSVEAYKNITENKGKITNLIGIGTMLLAHTEHSLFMFDTSNTLTTNDKTVQLSQPDAFEVEYKEVFTSDLGFGGLQDSDSYSIDQFGYIFYNNDFNRFYRFDNGSLAYIDEDIIQWLNRYKPFNVRFANDKINNRLLIKMDYNFNEEIKSTVISYNYNNKNFISLHTYDFNHGYNTKSELYLLSNIDSTNKIYQFVNDGSSYCEFDNGIDTSNTSKIYPSKISIISNNDYSIIKFLENITYKLNKVANNKEIDYTYSPVEGMITLFSGNYITIYNNQINTGKLDITVSTEDNKNVFSNYKKPYWELGNWNFSYIRNNIANYSNYGDAFNMSRVYGNYFITEFEFTNEDKLKIEFEDFNCKFSK